MKKVLLLVVLIVASFIYPSSSRADDKTKASLVNDLFVVTNMKEGYTQTVETVLDLQLQQNPQLVPLEGVLREFFTKYMGWEAIKGSIAELYINEFDEKELKDIVAFLSTPSGIIWSEKSFELATKGMEIGQALVNKNMGELENMIIAEMSKKEAAKNNETTPTE